MTCTAFHKRWARRLLMPFLASAMLYAHPAFSQSMILPEGLAISLETRQDISSKSAHEGDPVELAVAKAVTIGGVTLIPAGSPVVGEVVRVSDNGLLGRSGKLDIRINSLKAGQVDVPVRGRRNVEGKSGTLGSVGAAMVFLPLAILVRGKDVKMPAGTVFDVYVDKEVTIPSATAPLGDFNRAEPPPEAGAIRAIDPNEAIGP